MVSNASVGAATHCSDGVVSATAIMHVEAMHNLVVDSI